MKNEEAINALYEQLKSNFLETHHQGARYLSLVPAYNEDDGEHYRFRAYAIREGDEVEFLDDLHQTRQPLYRIEWDIDRDAIAEQGWDAYVADFVWDEIHHAYPVGYYVLNNATAFNDHDEPINLINPYTPSDYTFPIL